MNCVLADKVSPFIGPELVAVSMEDFSKSKVSKQRFRLRLDFLNLRPIVA